MRELDRIARLNHCVSMVFAAGIFAAFAIGSASRWNGFYETVVLVVKRRRAVGRRVGPGAGLGNEVKQPSGKARHQPAGVERWLDGGLSRAARGSRQAKLKMIRMSRRGAVKKTFTREDLIADRWLKEKFVELYADNRTMNTVAAFFGWLSLHHPERIPKGVSRYQQLATYVAEFLS